jgi:transposase
MGTRRRFSAEFKREAVALTAQPDVSVAQVARELGIGANLLGRWRRELHADEAKAFRGKGVARDEEVARLKRELARVRRERDFLKDAAAYFAKTSTSDTP